MSIEADWVYTGDRETLSAQNINIAYNPATGANYAFTGGAANVNQRVYPNFGNLQVNRNQGKTNYHGLQMAFTKRMSSGWQASATYTMGDQWTFDPYTLLPGCQYPMTIAGTGGARCDVPITLAPDIAENEYYLGSGPSGTGGTQEGQRHRFTFNGIKELPWGFQVSGLYLFGDNGRATPISGVDTRAIGNANSRLRADNTIIERNTFDRSAISRVDMRIQKRLRIGGRRSIDGIFEVFNVFNRKNFNSWVTNLSNARNGQPQQDTNLAYAARMLQLGFRVAF
jgi:hypothetical protein